MPDRCDGGDGFKSGAIDGQDLPRRYRPSNTAGGIHDASGCDAGPDAEFADSIIAVVRNEKIARRIQGQPKGFGELSSRRQTPITTEASSTTGRPDARNPRHLPTRRPSPISVLCPL